MLSFRLNQEAAYDSGLICGGQLNVYVEPVLAIELPPDPLLPAIPAIEADDGSGGDLLVEPGDSLVTIESEKASIELPCPFGGVVKVCQGAGDGG